MSRPAKVMAVWCAVCLVGAAGASGAKAAEGETALKLSVGSKRQLDRAGVRIGATGPARSRGRTIALAVRDGSVGALARASHRGAVRLRKRSGGRTRAVRLRRLTLTLSASRSFVTARFGGEQVTLLRLRPAAELPFNPLTGEVALRPAPARLTGVARRELSRRLGARLPKRIGRLSSSAHLDPTPPPEVEPPVLVRPGGAVDLASASLTWRARESFINYLHASGPAGGTTASEGAVPHPPEVIPPSSEARVYQWDLPFAHGWRDPQSGTARVQFGGLVNFRKWEQPYWLDLDARDPEVELTGANSRIILTLTGRGSNADDQNRRAVAVDLALPSVAPEVESTPAGTRYTWTRVPGSVPSGPTAWSPAGFYSAGDPWGWATISITVPEA